MVLKLQSRITQLQKQFICVFFLSFCSFLKFLFHPRIIHLQQFQLCMPLAHQPTICCSNLPVFTFFLQRENCSSQAACTGYGAALEGRLIAFLVFDPTYQRLCQSIWTGGATNLDKGAFGSAHFAISLTTNSSTDNRL